MVVLLLVDAYVVCIGEHMVVGVEHSIGGVVVVRSSVYADSVVVDCVVIVGYAYDIVVVVCLVWLMLVIVYIWSYVV